MAIKDDDGPDGDAPNREGHVHGVTVTGCAVGVSHFDASPIGTSRPRSSARSSFFNSPISSRYRAASSNCSSPAAARICSVNSLMSATRSAAAAPPRRGPAGAIRDPMLIEVVSAVSASSRARVSVMSAIFLRSGVGSMPCSTLYAICLSRRRFVSSIARAIDA